MIFKGNHVMPCIVSLYHSCAMDPLPKTPEETNNTNNGEQKTDEIISFEEYYNQLPKNTSLGGELVLHKAGFWCWARVLKPILSFQAHFQAQPTDIFIVGMPKTGHTWLKSLVFATMHRHHHPISDHPLRHYNSHLLVPHLEISVYRENPQPDLDKVLMYPNPPRILSTHLPFHALPKTIQDCKMIYVCRNPLDAFVSAWFFTKSIVEKINPNGLYPSMEDYFELYLQGITPFGPFFDHLLSYGKRSIEMPHKVLFVTYEELSEHTSLQLKRIAEFLEYPFSPVEEKNGVIEEIAKLCSIKNLKELTVNKEGKYGVLDNSVFFRKGEVRDWVNYLTPSMVDRMRDMMHQKFDGLNLPIKEAWF